MWAHLLSNMMTILFHYSVLQVKHREQTGCVVSGLQPLQELPITSVCMCTHTINS